ncbi:MAG: 50S ribosomal protein L30 [Thaumarchaeota archaeon]|nr:50S ribosomal protein L30 [Candidatus Calditenuaceae archaeon]MDW8043015.1 50S ribosomal protein L30 [Nitrososphaerota archaeon]
MEGSAKCYLVIRLRGPSGLSEEVEYTLRLMHLRRSQWASLVRADPSYLGMLNKVAPYVTWGEPDPEVLAKLFRKRAESWNRAPLSDVLSRLGCKDELELARKVVSGEIKLGELFNHLKPYFRLHPPKGGYRRSTKRMFADKGEAGYRGQAINELLRRMI